MNNQSTRAELSKESQAILKQLKPLLPRLNQLEGTYASIYYESKSKTTDAVDLKKSTITHDRVQGVVFRIYDGFTLFEEATDELGRDDLESSVDQLLKRVRSQKGSSQTPRPYIAPTWDERLKVTLDPEIRSQIPNNPTPETLVHFGIRYQKNPFLLTDAKRLQSLKDLMTKLNTLSPLAGLSPDDLTYIQIRQLLAREESIFIDQEVTLSQTLFRLFRSVAVMSGSEKNQALAGGLGGSECWEISDEELIEMLTDLQRLTEHEKLTPGHYRVLFSPSLSGVLAHEAFGHSQEGDTCARGRSKAWDLYQSQTTVGNQHATILNNPALFENGDSSFAAWGSYFFDEEGWLSQEQEILSQGKLQRPMTHLTSSLRLNVPRSANGKRENFSHGVYTRQTNTYFSAGKSTLRELLDQLKDGYLATHAAGGMEDPKGMGIQVGIAYLKEVKDGQLTGRVFKGPSGGDIQMTGYTPDVLNSIIGKSKISPHTKDQDRAKHPFNEVGGCGKYHKEFVYAGCGGPYLLMENITLG